MRRLASNYLKKWVFQPARLPLILRGARQVGKSYLIRELGKNHFENLVEVNFEYEKRYHACFDTFDPKVICQQISLVSGKPITPQKTLLFLDEIQDCPRAIEALRYFKENMPELHVIAAGSLLEFALRRENFRMPVGRVQYFYLYPFSFKEFLLALGHSQLVDWVENFLWSEQNFLAVHNQLMEFVRLYMALGGMPAVLQAYIERGDWLECQHLQNMLLKTYQDDLAKYHATVRYDVLSQVYHQVPSRVGEQIKYSRMAHETRAADVKKALWALDCANVIKLIFSTAASGLPLKSTANEKKFKLQFIDVGLMNRAAGSDIQAVLKQDLLQLNRGAIAEQFVGQCLQTAADPYDPTDLFFWARDALNSSAEVDFVMQYGRHIVPIEVKAAANGRLKSLHLFLQEKKLPFGIRVSSLPPSRSETVWSIPFYLVSELERLINR